MGRCDPLAPDHPHALPPQDRAPVSPPPLCGEGVTSRVEPSRLREGGGHPWSRGFMGEPGLEPRTQMSHLEFIVRGLLAPLMLMALAPLRG